MKVSSQILSLPPYISTSWENVLALRVEGSFLIIDLVAGTEVRVPNLSRAILEQIFNAHRQYLEKKGVEKEKNPPFLEEGINLPFKMGLSGVMEPLENFLQHNPEQSHLPNLPEDVLKKITSIAKAMGLTLSENLLKAEPHCNCAYCQIARTVQNRPEEDNKKEEEEVTKEDLSFKNWDIHQKSDQLYDVINPLDTNECYRVFLGDPLGCTCGEKNCEHIKAVLHS